MNVTAKQAAALLGLFGLSKGVQVFGEEGGFVAPETLTMMVQTIPLPYLVVIGFAAYYLWYSKPKPKLPPTIVCSSCRAIVAHVEEEPET